MKILNVFEETLLIYVAVGYKDKIEVREFNLSPHYNRKNMKFMFSECALKMVMELLSTLV